MVPLSAARSKLAAHPDFQTLSDSLYDPRLPGMSVATSLSIRETDALLVTTVPTVRLLPHISPTWPLLRTRHSRNIHRPVLLSDPTRKSFLSSL